MIVTVCAAGTLSLCALLLFTERGFSTSVALGWGPDN